MHAEHYNGSYSSDDIMQIMEGKVHIINIPQA